MLRGLTVSGRVLRGGWAALCLVAMGSVLAGCASSGAGGNGSTAAPSNYKQAVAVRMRELVDVSTVKSAQITRPHERFLGIFGGNRPAVCVSAVHPNMIGMDAPNPYMCYFNGGRAECYKQGYTGPGTQHMIGCGSQPYLPFPELRGR